MKVLWFHLTPYRALAGAFAERHRSARLDLTAAPRSRRFLDRGAVS